MRRRTTDREVDALIARNPLGMVATMRHGEALSTNLPFLFERDEDPAGVLHGHFVAANPQVAMLRCDPKALISFQEPGAYVSRCWLRGRAFSPAWLYASVELLAEIQFLECPGELHSYLDRFADRFEAGRAKDRPLAAVGGNYRELLKTIRPFKAWILRTRTHFELGQNEDPAVLRDVVAGLRSEGALEIAAMVEREARGAFAAKAA